MAAATPTHLTARKTPRQARATATLEAIFEATIQVLVAEGPRRLTTTRVAERAGVSIGSLYQYFPNKQALFYALNERYLEGLADRVEACCRAQHGTSASAMVEALIATYWKAKTERPEVTQALYRSVAELDNQAMIDRFSRRVDAATAAMLATAADARFADLPIVNLTLLSTIFGTVRNIFTRNLSAAESRAVHRQLVLLCQTYLEAVKTPSHSAEAA